MLCRIAIKFYRPISEQYSELEKKYFFVILIFGRLNLDSAFPTSPTEAILPKIEPKKFKTLPESADPTENF